MSSESLSARYLRSLIGVNPALDALARDSPLPTEGASIGKLALWEFFDDGLGKVSREGSHLLSRLLYRAARRSLPATPVEKRTHLGALLTGVQYMLDFRGANLARQRPPDPGAAIVDTWKEMLQELDEFLSNRQDWEG
jgi:hypothetical protein